MQVRKLSRHRLWEASHCVIPNLFRDLGFDPLGGPWTVDGQRGFSRRTAGSPFLSVQRFLGRDAETSS